MLTRVVIIVHTKNTAGDMCVMTKIGKQQRGKTREKEDQGEGPEKGIVAKRDQ